MDTAELMSDDDKIDWYIDHTERHAMYSAVAEAAGKRCSHDLTYRRSPQRRELTMDYIESGPIDDAFRPGKVSPGAWSVGDQPVRDSDNTEAWWIQTFAEAAVQEAVHEALEWFHVDGKVWMSPHGIHEDRIMRLCHEFFLNLVELRKQVVVMDEDDA